MDVAGVLALLTWGTFCGAGWLLYSTWREVGPPPSPAIGVIAIAAMFALLALAVSFTQSYLGGQ
jgi:hypothetical protein